MPVGPGYILGVNRFTERPPVYSSGGTLEGWKSTPDVIFLSKESLKNPNFPLEYTSLAHLKGKVKKKKANWLYYAD